MTMRYIHFLILVSSVLMSWNASACSCGHSTADQLLRQATYVFTAFVTSATLDKNAPSGKTMRLTVRVNEVIKGTPAKTMTVFAPAGGNHGGCGFLVSIGSEHLFVLDSDASGTACEGNGDLGTSFCSGAGNNFDLLLEFRELKKKATRKTSNQPLHHDASVGQTAAVVAGERRR